MDYKIFIPLAGQKNKPNSNPIKPNLKNVQMNVNSLMTKDYRKKDDFAVRKNKPNSNPISSKAKMSANAFSQKDYENKTAFRPQKNKPNQTQFQTRRRFFCLLHKRLTRRGVYPERSRRGPRNHIFWSFPAKSVCPAWKNVGTLNLLAIESYKIYLNYLLLLSN